MKKIFFTIFILFVFIVSVKAEDINFHNMTFLRCDTTFQLTNKAGDIDTHTERFHLYLDNNNRTMYFEDKSPFTIFVYNHERIKADRNIQDDKFIREVHYDIDRYTGRINITGHKRHKNKFTAAMTYQDWDYEGVGDCYALPNEPQF